MLASNSQDSFTKLQASGLSLFYTLSQSPDLIFVLLMPPVTNQPFSDSGLNLGFFSIPTSFLLQVGTASILLLVLAEKATLDNLQNLGEASEELLRGERLPILNFPDQNELNRS